MGIDSVQSISRKLSGYEFYRQVLGSPKFVVAPMVAQSELVRPWRILSRRYGANLAYTPMINAKMWSAGQNPVFREENFNTKNGEEGGVEIDRPLIIQFCANDPEQLLFCAKALEPHCDAIDLNLGCPQEIARRGNYGSFLQDDWDLIFRLINTLHVNLAIPVTAKFRVFSTVEKTVEYAKMLERAGAQILACHGRLRGQRGVNSGLADWPKIKAVKEAVSVPVFANGNILYYSDILACLAATGADAVMSAEGNLFNPAIFLPSTLLPPLGDPPHLPLDKLSEASVDPQVLLASEHLPHADLTLEYLSIVRSLKTRTDYSTIKGHMFKLMRPALNREKDLRDRLARPPNKQDDMLEYLEAIAKDMKARMDRDAKAAEGTIEGEIRLDRETGFKIVPHWLAQPYFRPPPPPPPPTETQKRKAEVSAALLASISL